jgi:hypothetical protein
MAHFNTKLNTLAALISPILGVHILEPFDPEFLFKVRPIPAAYEDNEETRYANLPAQTVS